MDEAIQYKPDSVQDGIHMGTDGVTTQSYRKKPEGVEQAAGFFDGRFPACVHREPKKHLLREGRRGC